VDRKEKMFRYIKRIVEQCPVCAEKLLKYAVELTIDQKEILRRDIEREKSRKYHEAS